MPNIEWPHISIIPEKVLTMSKLSRELAKEPMPITTIERNMYSTESGECEFAIEASCVNIDDLDESNLEPWELCLLNTYKMSADKDKSKYQAFLKIRPEPIGVQPTGEIRPVVLLAASLTELGFGLLKERVLDGSPYKGIFLEGNDEFKSLVIQLFSDSGLFWFKIDKNTEKAIIDHNKLTKCVESTQMLSHYLYSNYGLHNGHPSERLAVV